MLEKFIKNFNDDKNFIDNKIRNKYIKKAGLIGIVLNMILFITKIIIGILINSVAVLSDGFNNLADAMSSIMTFIGNIISEKPADEGHPYGHGRFEYISALIVSFFIMFTGIMLIRESIYKILEHEILNTSIITTVILILSIIIKWFIYDYNKVVGEKIDSIVLIGVAKDALNDIYGTTGIIISILIFKIFNINIDGYVGFLISLIFLKSGFEIAKESTNIILGKAPSKELIKDIERILIEDKSVRGYHSLELHEYGQGNIFGSVHLELPCNMIFKDVHEIADELEKEVKNSCNVNIVIHMDPVKCKESEVCKTYENKINKNH